MEMLTGNKMATKSLTDSFRSSIHSGLESLGATKNDAISLITGLVTGVTVTKVTGKKSLGVVAGVATTFVMADGLDNFEQRDRIVAEVEAEGGKVTYSDASIFNGFEVRYTDKDGRECTRRSF